MICKTIECILREKLLPGHNLPGGSFFCELFSTNSGTALEKTSSFPSHQETDFLHFDIVVNLFPPLRLHLPFINDRQYLLFGIRDSRKCEIFKIINNQYHIRGLGLLYEVPIYQEIFCYSVTF